MLGQGATGIDPFWGVLATTIGGIIVALLVQMRRTQRGVADDAKVVADSVGEKNGHGSIQEQIAELREDLLAERVQRQTGQGRQTDMQEAILSTQAMVASLRQHHADDAERTAAAVAALHAMVDRLEALIGQPEPGWDPTPLLPYVHQFRHDLTNQQTITRGLVQQAIAAVAEAHRILDAAAEPKEPE